MNANEVAKTRVSGPPPPMRGSHVPGRPYLTTGEAAQRLGKSLYWVTERIKNGTLEGYGIRASTRTSWFVFASAVESVERAMGADQRPELVPDQAPVHSLVAEAVALLQNARSQLQRERQLVTRLTTDLLQDIDSWDDEGDTRSQLRELHDRLAQGPVEREPVRDELDGLLHQLDNRLRRVQQVT